MRVSLKLVIVAFAATSLCFAAVRMFGIQNGALSAAAVADPGIRGGPAGAGQPFAAGLTASALRFFYEPGLEQFTQVEEVEEGLGPRFNLDSCAGCHAFPEVGGSS